MPGRDSELQRVYSMPSHMGHGDGINCMAVVEDKVYTGGRDNQLFGWRGSPGPGGTFELLQDSQPLEMGASVTAVLYDSATKWMFCGLWSGDIQAYCKDPIAEDRLVGHRRSVSSLVAHQGVVVSGSNDGTVRLWTRSPQGRYQAHGQPLTNATGAVTAVRVLGDALWVAAQNGITCFDLATLQPRGTIPSNHQVTGLVDFQGHMIATFRNGDLKVHDSGGREVHSLPARGEHTSNTAVAIMMHPVANVPLLLCGQQYGYVTAYDLPSLQPRGSWCCKNNSDVKAILDVQYDGMFLTAGLQGDIMAWRWGAPTGPGAGAPGAAPVASNPFASAQAAPVAQAASPFAPAGAAAGLGGGMNGGGVCGGGMCGGGMCGGGMCGGAMMN